MKIKLALEWFINPDHLPFLVAIDKKLYNKLNIDLEIIEPNDHYDGFKELALNNIQFATNEPLHLIEKYNENVLSLGNFFETEGGIIFTKNGYKKFIENSDINITSPVSNNVTDTIARDILDKYLQKISVGRNKKVNIIVKDFYHIKNLKEGMDAAWLCFENFEGIESELEGLDIKRIYLEDVNIPNFCALDLFTSDTFLNNNNALTRDFVLSTEEAINYFTNDLEYSKHVYYNYTKQEKSLLMDKIIENTIKRFHSPFHKSLIKWKNLYEYTKNNGITSVNDKEYMQMFAK